MTFPSFPTISPQRRCSKMHGCRDSTCLFSGLHRSRRTRTARPTAEALNHKLALRLSTTLGTWRATLRFRASSSLNVLPYIRPLSMTGLAYPVQFANELKSSTALSLPHPRNYLDFRTCGTRFQESGPEAKLSFCGLLRRLRRCTAAFSERAGIYRFRWWAATMFPFPSFPLPPSLIVFPLCQANSPLPCSSRTKSPPFLFLNSPFDNFEPGALCLLSPPLV